MRVLQSNIQSVNTSLPLLRHCVHRLHVETILLQEVWHPVDDQIIIRNYNKPIVKLRSDREGGGVAIITHNSVKTLHKAEYEVDGLEAVWADVMHRNVRMIVGSVYIPPGDVKALELLDDVINKILLTHNFLLISMDSNSRNVLWDDKSIGISPYSTSIKMGAVLENIISKHGLHIHNNGVSTYHSGSNISAPDVSLSTGLTAYGKITWSVIDDELKSPHDAIIIDIGDKSQHFRKEVVDWSQFDWCAYKVLTGDVLNKLYEEWLNADVLDIDIMASELSGVLQECVNKIAVTKVITHHSKPWIDKELSQQLQCLRKLKKKCKLRKSPANVAEYVKLQKDTVDKLSKAEEEWWLKECNRLLDSSESVKWKIINRLTNQPTSVQVQPIKKDCIDKDEYAFSDLDICHELENYHIHKSNHINLLESESEQDIRDKVSNLIEVAKKNSDCTDSINADISDHEVKCTFGRGTNTPGPDGISADLIDKADRTIMHACLKVLWNKAWCEGQFIQEWKRENRVVIPKPGKECYNDCSAYRTVSITACIGKRFECITSQRLIVFLKSCMFDVDQFAYLQNRSSTQALLIVVEKIKRSLLTGELAGVVFYDFTDAFGSVNRDHLLLKIAQDFHISGRLFLHIASFLQDRLARIKFADTIGEWFASYFGTSAGTSLGPILFVMHLHDIPNCIMPKFADDLVTISVGKDVTEIASKLQQSTDQLLLWTDKEAMQINVGKTKVMLFGDSCDEVKVSIHGVQLENVTSYKYLGVQLDQQLNFNMQTDYAVGKTKRALTKVCTLIKGRQGISVPIALQLYKTLIRPHLEYALPVWASLSEQDTKKLDLAQTQSLKRLIGAKVHSSSAAVEVVCGILPMRFRKRELCCREYARLLTKDVNHTLCELLHSSMRVGLKFCPMKYLSVMSKELERAMNGCVIVSPHCSLLLNTTVFDNVEVCDVYSDDEVSKSVKIYTDGSVCDGPLGWGACAAVLFPVCDDDEMQIDTCAVGRKVSSFETEVAGIVLGIKMCVEYYRRNPSAANYESVYLFCDNVTAIDAVNRSSPSIRPNSFTSLIELRKLLHAVNVCVKLIKVKGHSGSRGNTIADQKAKVTVSKMIKGIIHTPDTSYITVSEAYSMAADIAFKSWQRLWDNEATGRYTYELIPTVGTKILFPNSRDTGISYCRMLLHDTMLQQDSYRCGTSLSPVCDCGAEEESVEHFLLRCQNYSGIRNTMINNIEDCLDKKLTTAVTESLLLAPWFEKNIRKSDRDFIKECLFDFISSSNRKI